MRPRDLGYKFMHDSCQQYSCSLDTVEVLKGFQLLWDPQKPTYGSKEAENGAV